MRWTTLPCAWPNEIMRCSSLIWINRRATSRFRDAVSLDNFLSQAADKGRDVMIEYNERAAVSRIVIPALIEGWKTKQPERYAKWLSAIQSLQIAAIGALDEIETLLQELPLHANAH